MTNPRVSAHPGPTDAARPGAEPGADVLVREHLPLVGHEVRDAMGRLPAHVCRDELISAGMLALVQASRSFDPDRGVPFVGFARRRIRGAILDELRDMDWASRSVRRRERELDAVRGRLAAATGQVPSTVEVAAATGLTTGDLARHGSDLARASVTSLQDVAGDTAVGAPGTRPVEPDAVLLHREQMAYLHDAVATLPDRLRAVVQGWFFADRPMAELGVELGVSESRVSQMRAEALVLLKHALDAVLTADAAPVVPVGAGVVARRRGEYVLRLTGVRTVAERLAYVPETELRQSA